MLVLWLVVVPIVLRRKGRGHHGASIVGRPAPADGVSHWHMPRPSPTPVRRPVPASPARSGPIGNRVRIALGDGFEVFAIEGHEVPAAAVDDATELTVPEIQAEMEPFVRTHLVRRYGSDRYRETLLADPRLIATEPDVQLARTLMEEVGLETFCQLAGRVTSSDLDMAGEPRRLWRVDRRNAQSVVVVEVANSTPEPDGSRRRYWLRVPPHTTSCRDAVAWTFGLRGPQYELVRET